MRIVQYLLMVVEILSAVMIIGLVLIQRSKKEGLGLAFGAGMGESIFGSRASNVLIKITIVTATVFLVNTVLLAMVSMSVRGRRPSQSLLAGEGESAPAPTPQPAPPPAAQPDTGMDEGMPTVPPMDMPSEPPEPVPVPPPTQ